MAGQDPSPQTTLLILLGASRWPLLKLGGSTAFGNAASDLRNYFLFDPKGFHLPKSNILDLFDSDDSNTDILDRISDFLRDRITTKKQLNVDIRDVLVYYIGHGGITKESSIFYLAIRRTREDAEKSTSIAMDDLAERLKKGASFQRRILILDCCFAARALRFLQGSKPVAFVSAKTIAAFEEKDQGEGVPSRGTSFLASSGKDDPSVILPNETSTMFTSALLSALLTGDRYQEGEWLTLHTVHRLTEDFLRETHGNDFPQPELHSPDQTQGNIATTIAFFPNPSAGAERARLAEKERVRKAEEDRRRQAEAERARLAEVERVKKAEDERRIPELQDEWMLRPQTSGQQRRQTLPGTQAAGGASADTLRPAASQVVSPYKTVRQYRSLRRWREGEASYGEEAVNAWIEENRRLLGRQKREELQQLIGLPRSEEEVNAWIEENLSFLSRQKREELQQLIKFLRSEKEVTARFLKSRSREEVNAWIEENLSFLSSEERNDIRTLIQNYSRDSLHIQQLRIENRDLSWLVSFPSPQRQRLDKFLRSEAQLNAWIRKGILDRKITEEIRRLIKNLKPPLSSEEREEIERLKERQRAQEARRKRFTRVTWIPIVPNLLGTSVGLGILLHAWWIAVICLIGGLLLAWIMLASLENYLSSHREKALRLPFLLVGLLPVGIAWGLVGWFLNPVVSLRLHFPYPTLILAAFGFLLGLFVNFFLTLPFVRGLRLEK